MTSDPIILASSSPRRKEILKQMGIPFKIMVPNIDETIIEGLSPQEMTKTLAVQKVSKIVENLQHAHFYWILGADTLIVHNGEFIGKPSTHDEAYKIIQQLAGNEHTVYTSIALHQKQTGIIFTKTVETIVTFAPISKQEINWYLHSDEWQGVAGGYRIQGMASVFITSIIGSYSSVVGLPIHELYGMLREANFEF